MNPDVMTLGHKFHLLYCNGELHGSPGEAERQSCELKSLSFTVKSQVLSRVLAYGNMKMSLKSREETHSPVCSKSLIYFHFEGLDLQELV